jgi:hypothetical protein
MHLTKQPRYSPTATTNVEHDAKLTIRVFVFEISNLFVSTMHKTGARTHRLVVVR